MPPLPRQRQFDEMEEPTACATPFDDRSRPICLQDLLSRTRVIGLPYWLAAQSNF
jgi:hypothetical protein